MRFLLFFLAGGLLAQDVHNGPLQVIGDLTGASTGGVDFSAAAWMRIKIGTGTPSGALCSASGHVGRLYSRLDANAANASLYHCSQVSSGVYSWELGGGSGSTTDASLLTTGLLDLARLPATLTGKQAATAAALAANGANCGAGQAAAGVDASGAAEGCFTPSGGGGAGATSQLTDFAAAGTGTAALAITCATGRCNVQTGDTVTSFAGLSASCTLASGSYTAYAYIDQASAALAVGASTVPTSCTGATAVGSVTAYPAGAIPLWRATVTSGSISALTDDRSAFGVPKRVLVTGAGAPTRTETASAVTLDFASTGGGTPGGSGTQIQYNNAGAFAGLAGSSISGQSLTIAGDVTASTNGRVILGQEGGAGGSIKFIDAALNAATFQALSNGIDATTIWLGQTGTSGVALWRRGGVQLIPSGSIYTCSATTRGMFWVTQGGTGVKDDVQVCAKDASNVYAWRTIY